MVSKSKKLGQPSIIFITVGTTQFPFTRLFKAVDEVVCNLEKKRELIVQSGNTEYQWKYKNVKIYKYLSPPEMVKYIQKSTKIITHAGFGTLYTIYRNIGVDPLIVPRLKYYKEHIDDHQKYFIEYYINKASTLFQKNFTLNELTTTQISSYIRSESLINSSLSKLFNQSNQNVLITKLKNYLQRQ